MRAERASLAELGLLPDPTGHWVLATWLDHTHARPSHEALKRLIATPLPSAEEIRERQALLPELDALARQVNWSELTALATSVDRYLSSNYELLPIPELERAYFRFRYGDIVTAVVQGLGAVDALIAHATAVHSRIASMPADGAFGAVVTAFNDAVHDHRIVALRASVARERPLALARHDAIVRATRVPAGEHAAEARPLRARLAALIDAIWRLDAFCSLARASATIDGCVPEIGADDDGALTFDALRHPLLPEGVTNDLALSADERVLFLTGPNMAGKSTLLRAIGIATYCAGLGMSVAARAATIPLYDRLLVSISVRDNLQRGESLYLAEIRRVRGIVEAVARGDRVMAIFDEAFRGTNISDATEATALLVDGLARAGHGAFVIASHIADVAAQRGARAGVSCWRMEVDLDAESPRFTHRITRGVSDVRLGMLLLDAEGVGPLLRAMARGERSSAAPTRTPT